MEILQLGAHPLQLKEVYEVAKEGRVVGGSASAVEKIEAAHTFLITQIKSGEALYRSQYRIWTSLSCKDPTSRYRGSSI